MPDIVNKLGVIFAQRRDSRPLRNTGDQETASVTNRETRLTAILGSIIAELKRGDRIG